MIPWVSHSFKSSGADPARRSRARDGTFRRKYYVRSKHFVSPIGTSPIGIVSQPKAIAEPSLDYPDALAG